jgi:hypothetical protein
MTYDRLIQIIKEEVSADAEKKFGDYLFADDSYLSKQLHGDSTYEPNTEIEEKIENALASFFGVEDLVGENKGEVAKALRTLKKYEDSFPELLKPGTTTLYRGSVLPPNMYFQMKEHLETNKYIGATITIKPKSVVQSFTTNLITAEFFAGYNADIVKKYRGGYDPVGIVYQAQFSEEELILSAKLTDAFKDGPEFEIVRLGKKPFKAKIINFYNERGYVI